MSASRFLKDDELVDIMEEIQELCATANAIRAKNGIRNRQPLNNMDIVAPNGRFSYLAFMPDMVQIVKDECNVKQITVIDDSTVSFVV